MHDRSLFPETNDQFLARMLLSTREQHQISSKDATRLADLANGKNTSSLLPTMAEERRLHVDGQAAPTAQELVRD
jgi:hypothetical protein